MLFWLKHVTEQARKNEIVRWGIGVMLAVAYYSDYWEGLQIFNNILDFALYSLFYIALIAFSATFLFEKK